jgi:hypothetical protein
MTVRVSLIKQKKYKTTVLGGHRQENKRKRKKTANYAHPVGLDINTGYTQRPAANQHSLNTILHACNED